MADNSSSTPTESPLDYFQTPDKELDEWLGSLTVILSVIGLIGNISSLLYFWSMERKSLPDKIYIAIIAVDITTNIGFLSSASFLLSDRNTVLCNQSGLHLAAAILLRFSTKMSSFLVAVLSVLRSIVIVKPHKARQIRPRAVAYIVTGCALVLLLKDVLPVTLGWAVVQMQRNLDCPRLVLGPKMPGIVGLLVQIVDTVELFLTSVVVFVSFILSAIFLIKNSTNPSSNADTEGRSRQVSITIALFTAIFLLCNLPYFAWYILQILLIHAEPIKQNVVTFILETRSKWIVWNGNIVFSFLAVHLNAVLNPCLYLWRMPRYRNQLLIWWAKFREKLRRTLDCIPSCSHG